MPTQEELSTQIDLLQTHRRTLAHYLKQQALHGAAYTPPAVTHGIEDARDNIQRIKAILQSWGHSVEDEPNDNEDEADGQTDDLSLIWTGDKATISTGTGFIFEQSKYYDKSYHIMLHVQNIGKSVIHQLYVVLEIPRTLIFFLDLEEVLRLHLGNKSNWSIAANMDIVKATFKSNGAYSLYPGESVHACTLVVPIPPNAEYPSSCAIKYTSMSEQSGLVLSDCIIQIEPEDLGRKKYDLSP